MTELFRAGKLGGRWLVLPSAAIVAAALWGCTTSRTCPAPPARPTTASAPAMDIRATCALELKRELTCKQSFVPMIVDTRIKLDVPRGIAARGKDQAGREELIAIAHREFAVDRAPAKHRTICDGRQAMVDAMPPERLQQLKTVAGDCLAAADCEGYTRCVAPLLEKMLAAAPPRGAHAARGE